MRPAVALRGKRTYTTHADYALPLAIVAAGCRIDLPWSGNHGPATTAQKKSAQRCVKRRPFAKLGCRS